MYGQDGAMMAQLKAAYEGRSLGTIEQAASEVAQEMGRLESAVKGLVATRDELSQRLQPVLSNGPRAVANESNEKRREPSSPVGSYLRSMADVVLAETANLRGLLDTLAI